MDERKDLIQDIQAIEPSDLLAAAADAKSDGYRLGQACATKTEGGVEILYTFEKDETLKNLKVGLDDKAPEIQSISGIYWPAFIYENEMHDLFGVTFRNLALDYGGHFFKIASETPWNPAAAAKDSAAEAAESAEVTESSADAESSEADESAADAESAASSEQEQSKGGEA